MTKRFLLTVVLLSAIGLYPTMAQAATWEEMGEASTGESVSLYVESVRAERNVGGFRYDFAYQIGPDTITANVNCSTRKIYPNGYKAFIPNPGTATDRMVDRVCEIGRRLSKPPVSLRSRPLQAGGYRIGSKYIQIAKQGDRLCYRGMSNNGVTIASLIPSRNGFYQINGWSDGFVKQVDAEHLSLGDINNMTPYPIDRESSSEITPNLQACLDSTEPFFKQSERGRGQYGF
jgi:hypothetical protein